MSHMYTAVVYVHFLVHTTYMSEITSCCFAYYVGLMGLFYSTTAVIRCSTSGGSIGPDKTKTQTHYGSSTSIYVLLQEQHRPAVLG